MNQVFSMRGATASLFDADPCARTGVETEMGELISTFCAILSACIFLLLFPLWTTGPTYSTALLFELSTFIAFAFAEFAFHPPSACADLWCGTETANSEGDIICQWFLWWQQKAPHEPFVTARMRVSVVHNPDLHEVGAVRPLRGWGRPQNPYSRYSRSSKSSVSGRASRRDVFLNLRPNDARPHARPCQYRTPNPSPRPTR